MFIRHEVIEKNAFLFLVLTLITVAIGGLVEVVPLFTIETTVEHVQGVRPYSPLEQRGRDIYVREGCYLCHSQMIRALRDEVERYGHYSIAAESMYDHPFQWGSKRIGPDLARVGGKYSSEWHYAHLINAQSVVPESLMPHYAFLAETPLELRGRDIYVREGCYLCHSQQIRTLRDEVERYGHYSIAAESMYDHPFQWGSKRIGPDLARVGGKLKHPLILGVVGR